MDQNQRQDWEDDSFHYPQNESPEPSFSQTPPGYNPYTVQTPPNGFAVAALVMGIVSLLLMCCGLGFVTGSLGILFAILSRKNVRMSTQAKVGMGLSIAGFVISFVLFFFALFMYSDVYKDVLQQYDDFYYETDPGDSDSLPYNLSDYLDKFDNSYSDDTNTSKTM